MNDVSHWAAIELEQALSEVRDTKRELNRMRALLSEINELSSRAEKPEPVKSMQASLMDLYNDARARAQAGQQASELSYGLHSLLGGGYRGLF